MSKLKLVHKDLYERMNYLYQAANVTIASNPHSSSTTNDCCHQLLAISKRAVLKLDPTIKRALCKKCNALLIPGITATVRIQSKPSTHLVTTCLQCKTRKRFNCRRGYTLWSERLESDADQTVPSSVNRQSSNKDSTDPIIFKPELRDQISPDQLLHMDTDNSTKC